MDDWLFGNSVKRLSGWDSVQRGALAHAVGQWDHKEAGPRHTGRIRPGASLSK